MKGSSGDAAETYGGRYRRLRRLGTGGMASVFLAEDEVLGREVAVKRIHSASPEDALKRFRREARLGASVNHPNLVAVYDSITDEDSLLIVMEYVEGESLSQRLRRYKVSEEDALGILDQVASAIDHLHERSVIHRDVKPSNILIRKDGQAKLADLGIATATDMSSITASSAVIGSLPYMAPERLRGGSVDGGCDVFSLGAVAFEVLSGHRVHDAATPEEQIRLASSESAPDLIASWPGAPPPTARVLAQAMNRNPGSRQFSAAAFVSDLRQSLAASDDRGVPTAPFAVPLESDDDPPTTTIEDRPAIPPPVPPPRPPAPPGRPPPVTPPGSRSSNHRRRGALAALVLAAIAIAAVAIAASGDDGGGTSSPQAGSKQANQSSGGGKSDQGSGGNAGTASTPSTTTDTTAGTTTSEPPPETTPDTAVDAASLNDQGKALIDGGDPAGAIPLLQQAVDSYSPGTEDLTYYYALFNLGNALRLDGRPDEAIPYLEERLQYPDQTSTVQAELDLARQEAGGGAQRKTTAGDSGAPVAPEPKDNGKHEGEKNKKEKDPGGGVGPG